MSSHDVAFEDVCRRISEFGDRAALITVTAPNTPHVVSAVLDISEGRLLARVGAAYPSQSVDAPNSLLALGTSG